MENREENIEQGGGQEGQPEVVVTSIPVIDEIDQILNLNRGLLSDERIKELEAMKADKVKAAKNYVKEAGGMTEEEIAAKGGSAEGDEEEGGEQEGSEGGAGTENGGESGKKTPESEGSEKPKKNALGIDISSKKDKKPVSIEKMEDVYSVLQSQFGMKAKDIKDLGKFLTEQAPKWRADSTKLVEAEKKVDQFTKLFEQAPQPLIDAFRAHFAGEDYTKILAEKPVFDFSQPAEKQDAKKLVSHYFKGKFTEDQLNAMGTDEEDPSLTLAKEVAIDKYNSDKKNKESQVAAYETRVKQSLEARTTSVKSSIDYLKQSFPDVDPSHLSSVEQLMSGGPQKVVEYFCNPDGTFKQDAAERILLAKEGKSVITEIAEAARRAGETAANEDIVKRGSDGKKQRSGGSGSGNDISPEAKAELARLKKLKDAQGVRF